MEMTVEASFARAEGDWSTGELALSFHRGDRVEASPVWTLRLISPDEIPMRVIAPATREGIESWLEQAIEHPIVRRTMTADTLDDQVFAAWERLARAFFERGELTFTSACVL